MDFSPDLYTFARRTLPVLLLAYFWCWETWHPFLGQREGRLPHAARNLGIALFNSAFLALSFGIVTVWVGQWTEDNQCGLLHALALARPARLGLALLLIDASMYLWHRANHSVPLLWRFHRMHHSDPHMDVTTATRFHLGEHLGSSVLRLGLIPVLGLEVWDIVLYDTLAVAATQFHHADVSIGRWDRWLRVFIVTPDMHKVHHSDWRPETDSNYSTVLSVWDRLARTLRTRTDAKGVVYGLKEFRDPGWQSVWGLWKTPFSNPEGASAQVDRQPTGDRANPKREELLPRG